MTSTNTVRPDFFIEQVKDGYTLDIDGRSSGLIINDLGIDHLKQAFYNLPIYRLPQTFFGYDGCPDDGDIFYLQNFSVGEDYLVIGSTTKKALDCVADVLTEVFCWDKK